MELEVPKVMGILNVTPDSFYSGSRCVREGKIEEAIERMISEGVDIIDVGGCSTRPGGEIVSEEEEMQRVESGCSKVRKIDSKIPLSVDTFRSRVAGMAIENYGADIINDVSGGEDPDMWPLIAEKKVVYILTHNTAKHIEYKDVTAEVITNLSFKLSELHRLGICDVIVDPGFGFGKNIEENFRLLKELDEIKRIGSPVLVGISRKSMIYKSLDITPEESLEGTVSLNSWALDRGADILRVHDIKAAKETVKLYTLMIK